MKYFKNLVTGMVHAYDDDAPKTFMPPELVRMSEEQVKMYIEGVAASQPSAEDIERSWRDSELASSIWLRDRHRDQVEMAIETSLGAEHFEQLLSYLQALRDWPQAIDFPDTSARPSLPDFIARQESRA